MQIYIPTYGRHEIQHTLKHLPEKLQRRTKLVVQARDWKENKNTYHLYPCDGVVVLPPHIQTIAPARQFIMDLAHKQRIDKLVMLDDDLRFDTRRMDDKGKFVVSTDEDVIRLFKRIEKELDKYAHVGVLSREGGNRVPSATVQCTRMMRVLAYNVGVYHENKIKFDRLPLAEDFDVTLQLLRKGFPNLVLCEWVNGQGTSGAKGGCSHFRTIDLHNENAKKLAALHPEFIKVVEKQTKSAWGGQARLDVVVAWKKAYASSQK